MPALQTYFTWAGTGHHAPSGKAARADLGRNGPWLVATRGRAPRHTSMNCGQISPLRTGMTVAQAEAIEAIVSISLRSKQGEYMTRQPKIFTPGGLAALSMMATV